MTNEQKYLLALLKKALFLKTETVVREGKINLGDVLTMSMSQEVFTFIYHVLSEAVSSEQLRTLYFKEISRTVSLSEHAEVLFKALVAGGVRFIPLKGVTFRDVYPVAEERTMGDIDVLVDQADYERARGIIMALGYEEQPENKESAHHVVFTSDRAMVELHHALTDYRRHDASYNAFETGIWTRAVKGQACGVPVSLMGETDTLVYMLIHMTAHFLVAGIGLKQVVDFALYVERHGDAVDWAEFGRMCQDFHLDGLADAVSALSNVYFGTEIPLIGREGVDAALSAEVLLEDIWKSGNLGREAVGQSTGSVFLKDPHQGVDRSIMVNLVLLFKHFRLEVGKTFPVASRNKLLLPFAYVLFFIRRIGSKNGGGFGAIVYAFRSIQESKKRYALAQKMGLR